MRVSADGAFVQVDADDHSILFFRSLLSPEVFMRKRVLGAIIQALNESLESDCGLIKVRCKKKKFSALLRNANCIDKLADIAKIIIYLIQFNSVCQFAI
jgi:hypothetical protein